MPGADSRRDDTGSNYARYIGVGFTFVLALAVPAVAGYVADTLFGTLPLFLLLGFGLGFVIGLYNVYLILKKMGSG